MGTNIENKPVIPFVKAVQVGNYKLWRSKYALSRGKEKNEIECLHVSNLDGSWMVRIPATMPLYGTICIGYTLEEKQRNEFLGSIFKNIYTLGTSSSEALHHGYSILYEILSYPYLLLSEKEMVNRMKAVFKDAGISKKDSDEQIEKMTVYRKQLYELIEKLKNGLLEDYERQNALQKEYKRISEEEDLKKDDIAGQAMEILEEQ